MVACFGARILAYTPTSERLLEHFLTEGQVTDILQTEFGSLLRVGLGRRPSGEKSSGTAAVLCDLPCNRLKPDCFQALPFRIGIQIGVRRGHAERTDFQRHRQMQGITCAHAAARIAHHARRFFE